MTVPEDPADEYRKSLRQWTCLWGIGGLLSVAAGVHAGEMDAVAVGGVALALAALAIWREYRERQRWRANTDGEGR